MGVCVWVFYIREISINLQSVVNNNNKKSADTEEMSLFINCNTRAFNRDNETIEINCVSVWLSGEKRDFVSIRKNLARGLSIQTKKLILTIQILYKCLRKK